MGSSPLLFFDGLILLSTPRVYPSARRLPCKRRTPGFEPGSPAFVEVGATVKKGDVLCIIEAMKLMNEIDSEYDGEVTNIYIENGQPVQYGERLFAIRTRCMPKR